MTARKLFVMAIVLLMGAGLAWARGGAARGGGARPVVPGKPKAEGGTVLDERRERTKRLRELSGPSTATPPATTTPTASAPRRRPTPPAPRRDLSLVHLHHGSVRMVAGLARVALTLEVQNPTRRVMEWERTYAIDPAAEIIGAVLKRLGEDPIRARTLTTADARRVYARIRTPPPSRTPRGRNRDPLLVARERNDRLRVQIWPINPGETVRVELTFVTPLRGEGAHRTYVDVMGGPTRKSSKTPRLTRPERSNERPRRPASMVDHKADWLVQPGELVLSSAPATGMTLSGQAGGKLHFTGKAVTTQDKPAPRLPLLSKQRSAAAVLVGSGSYAGRIATWRFDPRAYLVSKGFTVYDTLTVRLVPVRGSCRRLAPDTFAATAEPRPVTARVASRTAKDLSYRVEVLDEGGQVVIGFDESVPLVRKELDTELEGAISGWHRAQLVRHVFGWAANDAARRSAAQRFAVDMGVLVPGSAAIAIPVAEKARLTRELRRLYETDGVPLGAQRREADFTQVPKGALR